MPQQVLRELRIAAGLTYQQAAKRAGISTPGYWQIENGKRGASYSTMVKLAKVFNTTPDHIFLGNILSE